MLAGMGLHLPSGYTPPHTHPTPPWGEAAPAQGGCLAAQDHTALTEPWMLG